MALFGMLRKMQKFSVARTFCGTKSHSIFTFDRFLAAELERIERERELKRRQINRKFAVGLSIPPPSTGLQRQYNGGTERGTARGASPGMSAKSPMFSTVARRVREVANVTPRQERNIGRREEGRKECSLETCLISTLPPLYSAAFQQRMHCSQEVAPGKMAARAGLDWRIHTIPLQQIYSTE